LRGSFVWKGSCMRKKAFQEARPARSSFKKKGKGGVGGKTRDGKPVVQESGKKGAKAKIRRGRTRNRSPPEKKTTPQFFGGEEKETSGLKREETTGVLGKREGVRP